MPDKERKRVVKWAKQQITENHSNCTSPPSNSSSSKKLVIKSETTSWKKKITINYQEEGREARRDGQYKVEEVEVTQQKEALER